jgi:hypothetical protein
MTRTFKRSPYWKTLRHFGSKTTQSRKKDIKRTETKIQLRKQTHDHNSKQTET